MADFEMPSLGADMESGVLIEWRVQPGQEVHRGQVVAVVETDKGAIDVEIFQDGVIEALLVEPETEVPVGTPMARVRVDGEPAGPVADGPVADGPVADGPVAAVEPSPAASVASPVVAPGAAPPGDRVRASPRARKLAATLGVELRGVSGTGPQGSISAQDVQNAASASGEAPTVVRPTGMRAAIGAAMSRSKREIPHFYLQHSIDLEPALRWLEARNAEVSIAERVLPVALLVRAVARALEKYPQLCGWWRDGGFVPAPGIHVGLAVALRDGGLVDPALHHADRGSLSELFAKIRDVTKRARSSQLRSSELSDAAITVTSLGDQGVETVFGVIHPPQVAIVGVGVIAPRPWVVEGRVEARRVVTVTLAADHRASDGHGGARFLRSVDDHLQEPQRL
ncbi:MAG: dihydrolipoamide acetyltransferase family protein [Nannocystaceae bacterium]